MEAIELTYTQDDFLEAQRLHHTVSLRGRRFATRIGLWAVVLGLFFAVLPSDTVYGRIGFGLGVTIFYIVLMTISVSLSRFFFLPRASKRQFVQRKLFQKSMKFEICPPSIEITNENGFSKMPTEDFLKWTQNRKSILLYHSDNLFSFIPRRAVDDAFYAGLMAELGRANVPKAVFSNS